MSLYDTFLQEITRVLQESDTRNKETLKRAEDSEKLASELATQLAECKETIERQAAEHETKNSELQAAIDKAKTLNVPSITPPPEQSEENKTPAVDGFIDIVVGLPETDLTAEDVPTAGQPEETPESELQAAIDSLANALDSDSDEAEIRQAESQTASLANPGA